MRSDPRRGSSRFAAVHSSELSSPDVSRSRHSPVVPLTPTHTDAGGPGRPPARGGVVFDPVARRGPRRPAVVGSVHALADRSRVQRRRGPRIDREGDDPEVVRQTGVGAPSTCAAVVDRNTPVVGPTVSWRRTRLPSGRRRSPPFRVVDREDALPRHSAVGSPVRPSMYVTAEMVFGSSRDRWRRPRGRNLPELRMRTSMPGPVGRVVDTATVRPA